MNTKRPSKEETAGHNDCFKIIFRMIMKAEFELHNFGRKYSTFFKKAVTQRGVISYFYIRYKDFNIKRKNGPCKRFWNYQKERM